MWNFRSENWVPQSVPELNTIKVAVFSKNTGHEINFIIHIIFHVRLDKK